MKPLFHDFLMIISLFALLVSCSDDDLAEIAEQPHPIVNTWQFTGGKSVVHTDKDLRTLYQDYFEELNNPLTEEQLDSIVMAFQAPTIAFREGSTYEFQSDGSILTDGVEEGEWQINGTIDCIEAVMIGSSSRNVPPLQFKIERVNDTQLQLWLDEREILGWEGPLGFRIGPDELLFGYNYTFEVR